MCWRGFGFVHHSRTSFCRAVPNPNITIRNFFIAEGPHALQGFLPHSLVAHLPHAQAEARAEAQRRAREQQLQRARGHHRHEGLAQ
jgi:hypothetical protein